MVSCQAYHSPMFALDDLYVGIVEVFADAQRENTNRTHAYINRRIAENQARESAYSKAYHSAVLKDPIRGPAERERIKKGKARRLLLDKQLRAFRAGSAWQ